MCSIYGIQSTRHKDNDENPMQTINRGKYHKLDICRQTYSRYYPIQEIFHTLISVILSP